ncbi:hypothetical protein LCGC14_0442280 [marine sediment metagenome]|uniref:Uncharacterized protein n=1 Tax=marine sediment metagenome TaxID=412755 RepID=A0A0F9VUG3_9ZZZZ
MEEETPTVPAEVEVEEESTEAEVKDEEKSAETSGMRGFTADKKTE